jgi:hypothetical protein
VLEKHAPTHTHKHTHADMPTFMYICMSMTYFLKLEIMCYKGLREWDRKKNSFHSPWKIWFGDMIAAMPLVMLSHGNDTNVWIKFIRFYTIESMTAHVYESNHYFLINIDITHYPVLCYHFHCRLLFTQTFGMYVWNLDLFFLMSKFRNNWLNIYSLLSLRLWCHVVWQVISSILKDLTVSFLRVH